MEVEVNAIVFDSRQVKPGCVFVATRGTTVDGHTFIEKAVADGATAVVGEAMPVVRQSNVTYVTVKESREALGIMASHFYGNPSTKLKLVGVTGTNGKTTTVTLLHQLFRKLGYQVGLLSTVQNQINEEILPSTHTTPDAVRMNELMAQMVERGCTHCFMEVSSHSVDQRRIAGLKYKGAIFSNITHDHLDYHKTFDAYIKAKKAFFDGLSADAFALVNGDDKRGFVMLQNTKAAKYYFALKTEADFKGRLLANSLQGLEMDIDGKPVWFQLIGAFNAYNILSVYGAAVLLGEDSEEVLTQLSSIKPSIGRFDQLEFDGITAIVDYAHTPDALENVLQTIDDLRSGGEQVITLVGCGGNRDKTKRPLMAQIACRFSDKVILTSDNPRDEDPAEILKEMEAGISPSDRRKVLTIVDRREAIKTACMLSQPKDIMLVAGKGHETYQEIKGVKYPFDDKQVVMEAFKTVKG